MLIRLFIVLAVRDTSAILHRGQGAEYEQCRNHPGIRTPELREWRLAASGRDRVRRRYQPRYCGGAGAHPALDIR